jgi:8-oxo-dGTP pyrophosphatase MutT (NUDIX family)/predicted ABC-type ATPase
VSLASRLLGVRAASTTGKTVAPRGASANVYYSAPGIPQIPEWDGATALRNGYLASLYVMRCARKTAEKLASFPFRAGADPDKPTDFNPVSPLSMMLGPATRQSPGGPNPQWSARSFWIWVIIQRLICGRMAWETVTTQPHGVGQPAALWPLVTPFLMPVPSGAPRPSNLVNLGQSPWDLSGPNPTRYFDGFQYQLPTGYVNYYPDEVFYSWRPSQLDPRQPESVLQAAALPVSLQIGLERYLWALAKNGMVGKTLVVTPPFDEEDEEAAFRSQFLSEFAGYDNAGKTMFATIDEDAGDSNARAGAYASQRQSVQALKLDNSPTDTRALELLKAMYEQIRVAFGTPKSKLVDATDSTYANSEQDDLNWTLDEIIPLGQEIADDINSRLAPRFGEDVGWFDFSQALKPRGIFAAIAPDNALKAGLITRDDWRNDVGLEALGDEQALAVDGPSVVAAGTGQQDGQRAATQTPTVIAAGLAVKALDTGRVLLLQRSMDDTDPASGTWEFPGGKLDPGEDPFAAAVREWQEEVGCSLPQGRVAGSWTSPNGIYRGFVYLIAAESLVSCNLDHEDRHVLNPDDPDGDMIEVVAWWNPAQLPGMNGLRPEAKTGTDWSLIATAGEGSAPASAAGTRAPVDGGETPELWAAVGEMLGWTGSRDFDPAELRDEHGRWSKTAALAHALEHAAVNADDVAAFRGGSAEHHLVHAADGSVHFTPERAALHAKIISEMLDGHAPQDHPEYHLMGGGPASGKSTMMDAIATADAAVVNADEVKTRLPEYATHGPEGASFTHEESSYVAKMALAEGFRRKINLTLDGTGDSSAASLQKKIDQAHAAGYTVHGHYVTIPTEEAVRRAELRGQRSGRYVPRTVIEGTHRNVSAVLPGMLGKFDTVDVYDNTDKLVKILQKDYGKDPRILRRDLWEAFLAKGREAAKV